MSAQPTSARPVVDVSELPKHNFDAHSPIWWGNLWLLAIETTMFIIALATYFYLQQNFQQWPPPLTSHPYNVDPIPALTAGTANMILLVLSCVPMFLVDRAARRGDRRMVRIGIAICILMGIAMFVLRYYEFPAMKFQWDSNAYGSITWAILTLHSMHLLTTWLEVVLLATWVFTQPLDMHRRVDLSVLAVYWYWVAGIWIPFYVVLYFAPRMI